MFVARLMSRILPRVEIVPPLDPNVISSDPDQVRLVRLQLSNLCGWFRYRETVKKCLKSNKFTILLDVFECSYYICHLLYTHRISVCHPLLESSYANEYLINNESYY